MVNKMRYNLDYLKKFSFYTHLTEFEKDFLNYHIFRLEKLAKIIGGLIHDDMSVLNIGMSVFDLLIQPTIEEHKKLQYSVSVPALSFLTNKSNLYKSINTIEIDLCKPKSANLENQSSRFDFIIFSGVLEHMFCSDSIVLSNISNLLKEKGLLYISVPNAARLSNRIKLLLGKNISWSKEDIVGGTEFGGYGHIREYTVGELNELLFKDFELLKFYKMNDYPWRGHNMAWLNYILPLSYSADISSVWKKKAV